MPCYFLVLQRVKWIQHWPPTKGSKAVQENLSVHIYRVIVENGRRTESEEPEGIITIQNIYNKRTN